MHVMQTSTCASRLCTTYQKCAMRARRAHVVVGTQRRSHGSHARNAVKGGRRQPRGAKRARRRQRGAQPRRVQQRRTQGGVQREQCERELRRGHAQRARAGHAPGKGRGHATRGEQRWQRERESARVRACALRDLPETCAAKVRAYARVRTTRPASDVRGKTRRGWHRRGVFC